MKHVIVFLLALIINSEIFSQVPDTSIFYTLSIKSQGSEKALDVINDGNNNRLTISKSGNYSGQAWKFSSAGNDNYRISCSWLGDSKCIAVINDGTNDKVQISTSNNLTNQLWKLNPLRDGSYRITNVWQGAKKSLEVAIDRNNYYIRLAATSNKTNQIWVLKTVTASPAQTEQSAVTGFKEKVPENTGSNVSQAEAQRALDAHNASRDLVHVPHLKWSVELSAVAQKWAEKLAVDCKLKHSQGKYGENLATGAGFNLTAYDAFVLWDGEKKLYHNEAISNASTGTGHYTQVVWKSTTAVGMGIATCENGAIIVVANYDPPGNYVGQKPY